MGQQPHGVWGQSVPMDIGGLGWPEDEEWSVDAVSAGTQCYRCGGKGHMASQCPTQKGKGKGQEKGKGKGKGKGNSAEKGKGEGKGYQGTCWNCGKVGHKASECWERASAAAVEEVDDNEGDDEDGRRSVDSVWMIPSVEERAKPRGAAKSEAPRSGQGPGRRTASRRGSEPGR